MFVAIRNLSEQTPCTFSHAVLVPWHVAIYTLDNRREQRCGSCPAWREGSLSDLLLCLPWNARATVCRGTVWPPKATVFSCLPLSTYGEYGRPIWAF